MTRCQSRRKQSEALSLSLESPKPNTQTLATTWRVKGLSKWDDRVDTVTYKGDESSYLAPGWLVEFRHLELA